MILKIPIKQNAASWTQRMTLDGVSYILDFAWNGRDGAYYLSILDATGTPLIRSRKLVANRPILKRYRFVAGIPAGEIIASDPTKTIEYPGYGQLGLEVPLYYFDKSELA